MRLDYTVKPEQDGTTVKNILKNKLSLSERLVKKLKFSGRIFINDVPVRVVDIVRTGDQVSVDLDFNEENKEIIPQEIPINIVYEDEWLIAVNKQAGIVVHPTGSHRDGTIANALSHHLKMNGETNRIRPVSRLDRDTSGLIVFAKSEFIQQSLIKQMHDKTLVKKYIGIVHGNMARPAGTIDLPIDRKPGSIMLRHVSDEGSPSVTHFSVIEDFTNAALLDFRLETGRTHQIRVHCQAIGHSLIGDTLYPPHIHQECCFLCSLISRQALHSISITFRHPYSQNSVLLTAPIPDDICRILEILKKSR